MILCLSFVAWVSSNTKNELGPKYECVSESNEFSNLMCRVERTHINCHLTDLLVNTNFHSSTAAAAGVAKQSMPRRVFAMVGKSGRFAGDCVTYGVRSVYSGSLVCVEEHDGC